MELAINIIYFLIVIVLAPVFLGAFLSHRVLKTSLLEREFSLRNILLFGYSIYGSIFVCFDFLVLHFQKIENHRESIWKYFCIIISILLVIFEIKFLFTKIKEALHSKKVDKILFIVIFVIFVILSVVLYHRRYQADVELYLSGYQEDSDFIYDFYAMTCGITGFRNARVIYYIYSFLFIIIYFCFYKTLGIFLFSEENSDKEKTNNKAAHFVYFVILFLLFPVFSSSLDIFGVFTCPWKSETLFASLFAPSIFLSGLLFIKVNSKKESALNERIRSVLFIFLMSLTSILSSRAGAVLGIFTLFLSIVISIIKKRVFPNTFKEGE